MSVGQSGLLDNLVTQFSSALDCFRELVQNSIDAGTPAVEVWSEFERGEGHLGVISIHVDDFGEGMDEAIIDDQLTCLFSSTKEDDMTKIGKFGIGFVSVFALEPKGVLVTTGRGGQYWEIFFHEDRSFTKNTLDVPTEGTQITIFKEGNYRQYQEMVRGIYDILKRWCAHAETEVTFEDRTPPEGQWPEQRPINEPFEVSGDCMVELDDPSLGTHVVMSYSPKTFYGFYNRGLTLAQDTIGENVLDHRHPRYRHISFKVKSRYLEHTLSRETIVRDENYEKAMVILDQVANDVLFDKLLTSLEAIVARPEWVLEDIEEYIKLLGYLLQEPTSQIARIEHRKIFRQLSGQPASAINLLMWLRRDNELLFDDHRSGISDTLQAQGMPVVFGVVSHTGDDTDTRLSVVARVVGRFVSYHFERSATGRGKRLMRWALARKRTISDDVRAMFAHPEARYMPVIIQTDLTPKQAALLESANTLLGSIDTRYKSLAAFILDGPRDPFPLFVVAKKLSPLMREPIPDEILDAKRLSAAVNLQHPHFRMLVDLYPTQPQLAAYCLVKDILLDQDTRLELDLQLMIEAQSLSATA